MALPKEPRQKMINIMYLVLTALLAINISAEILNAFKTIDNSLSNTNRTISNSTSTIMSSFQEKMKNPETAEKAKIWGDKAVQVQKLTTDIYNYVEGLRNRIHKEAGFDPAAKEGDSTFKEDNQDVTQRIMIEQREGAKLKARLDQYKKALLAIDPIIAQQFTNSLQVNTEIPEVKNRSNNSFEEAYFYMVPTVASMAMLRKFQNDIRTSENRVIATLHDQVGRVEVVFDKYAAIIGQSSNYLMPGQEIEIKAGVGAFSTSALPQITINGAGAPLGEDGAATAKFAAGGVGNHTIPVSITYTDQTTGKRETITKTIEYTVGSANAAISLDKMNVLYIGVDNPVTIAASGGSEQIQPTISGGGGSLTKVGPGKYIARVNSVTDACRITVSVQGKVAGASDFRVRTIPDPVATVGGRASGDNVNAGEFRAQAGVGAYIKDFPFDLKYSVTGFMLSTDSDDGDIIEAPVSGNSWGAAQNVLRQVKAGKTVYIDNIYATGPDGRRRKLPSLVYYIK